MSDPLVGVHVFAVCTSVPLSKLCVCLSGGYLLSSRIYHLKAALGPGADGGSAPRPARMPPCAVRTRDTCEHTHNHTCAVTST